jgi:hypothetical protein
LGNRSYWGAFNPLFSDYDIFGPESEIADFTGRKTGPIIPFWGADLLPDLTASADNKSLGKVIFSGLMTRGQFRIFSFTLRT